LRKKPILFSILPIIYWIYGGCKAFLAGELRLKGVKSRFIERLSRILLKCADKPAKGDAICLHLLLRTPCELATNNCAVQQAKDEHCRGAAADFDGHAAVGTGWIHKKKEGFGVDEKPSFLGYHNSGVFTRTISSS
jgi:hypothetical protein